MSLIIDYNTKAVNSIVHMELNFSNNKYLNFVRLEARIRNSFELLILISVRNHVVNFQ